MNADNRTRVPLYFEKIIGTPTPTRPIGYTELGEPVWPITSDPMGDCDHEYGWVCNELGEHTDEPYTEVNHLLRLVYAQLEASEAKYDYGSHPLRTLRANLYMVLSMADGEATDPCVDCDHPVRSHDQAFPAPCMVTSCKCGAYENGEPVNDPKMCNPCASAGYTRCVCPAEPW